MGYHTRFTGQLMFTNELTVPMLQKLQTFFGEDPRNHPEWEAPRDMGYVDLELTKDFKGIQWDSGTEKTYGLQHSVNVVLLGMRKEWPEFGLTGSLLAQGEDIEDRWRLEIGEDGMAYKIPVAVQGVKVTCPHCRHTFLAQ